MKNYSGFPREAVFAVALLGSTLSASAHLDISSGFALNDYFSHTTTAQIISYDWDTAGRLYYMTSAGYPDVGFWRRDVGGPTNLYANANHFSGASVVAIGDFVYFNDSDFSNHQFIRAYGPVSGAASVTAVSQTANYGLYTHQNRLFITGAVGFGTNQIYVSDLLTDGDLSPDPARSLGLTSGSSGPLAFDLSGDLYYAPGFGDLSIYKWSAAELSLAIADPAQHPLSVSGHRWLDYSSLYGDVSGATSMLLGPDGNLLVTLTSFTSSSVLAQFETTAQGIYNGEYQTILSASDRLGELRMREGEVFLSTENRIVQVVPEPATFAVALLGFSLLLSRRFRRRPLALTAAALVTLSGATAFAGPYTSYNGGTGPDTPISVSSISTWASFIYDYKPAPGLGPNFRNPAVTSGFVCLGDLYDPANPPAVGTEPNAFHAGSGAANFFPFGGNLNDPSDTYGFFGIDAPGSITFQFPNGIFDGPGPDLAVRENGFASGPAPGFFAELAFVEVSSNGTDFLRFPSISLNTTRVSTAGTFQLYDMTNVYNLAGKHGSTMATPFDLAELANEALVLSGVVNLNAITFIRLVDVIGNGTASLDSQGRGILDNWVTFDSGGFDVVMSGGQAQAVGVINAVPEPTTLLLSLGGLLLVATQRRRPTTRA